jgi:hypothetical protein
MGLTIIRILYLLFGLLFVKAGVDNAQTLWDVATPDRQFAKRAGVVEEVIKHRNPVFESADNHGIPFVAEVKFSYSVDGTRYVTNTFSARCYWCSPKDVLDVTGFRPGKLAVGTPVAVFFKRDKPEVAYLQLTTKTDVLHQTGFTLLWLVIAPLFLFWHYKMWPGRKPESASDD